jgi:hypothetical protein
MPILPAGQRRYLFEKNLLYLLSYDANVRETARAFVPGGGAIEWTANKTAAGDSAHGGRARPSAGPAYHVLDDDRIDENDSITGHVIEIHDRIVIPADERIATLEGTVIIDTSDRAVLAGHYRGSLVLGPLGGDRFAPGGDENKLLRIKTLVIFRFETTFPKYKWITERLCAGFGFIEVGGGIVRTLSFDLYAMR